jgi:hypothetical protein
MLTTTVTRVSITEDAPVQAQQTRRPTLAWWWLVAASVLLLATVAAALFVLWVRTRETRTTSYRVLGDLAAVHLDLGTADVEVDGGATAVEVKRVDKFAFHKPSLETHRVVNGTLNITSRCPDQVVGSCRASFRVTVPDNVPLEIQTSSGSVNLAGVRSSVQLASGSGDISATGFCGFALRAISDSGDLDVASECSADRLELRSRNGDVHAIVPAGRYQLDAQSDGGSTRTRGLTAVDDAAFQIQALSTNGDVTVEAAS